MVPILIGGAVITGLYGVVKGALGAKNHSDASELNDSAISVVDAANRRVDEQRKATNAMLEDYGARKLRAFNGTISDFLEVFGRLKNVELISTPELDTLNVGDFSTKTLQGLRDDYALLKSSGLGLGSGLTGGAAMAFGAYNGTMLLATASTGTAISTLSGAAATNATLAWLGGGSLAAGGGGMAMGAMVLGGLVAGPALAIFGHIVGNKGEEALNNARSNMEQANVFKEQAVVMSGKLEAVERVTSLANTTFSKISSKLRHGVRGLKGVIDSNGEDYATYSPEAKEVVFLSVKFAQLLKAMIDAPILDEEGNLVLSTEKRVEEVAALTA
ncbi:hypothetical protein [Burkholderia sp. Ac-20379]|uniref:hypothetical protein n=1 Tax=Burkholderia sp. Ac-20379 TaxID=2703900 RepID=UPI001F11E97E|nr:hypothetical protein [Burkholderia sp. Ac-20379]